MSVDPAPPSSSRPPGVLVIAGVLTVQAVALMVLAVRFVLTIFGANPLSVGGSVFMTVLLILVAAGLVTLAHRLSLGFRWPRSPALVVQVFLVILSFPYFSSGNPLFGVLLLVPAAVVIVVLFSKPVVRFTVRVSGAGRML
ncbi:hypothetical protein E8P82_09995 [Arthrobacter echini]|uniref:Integral membrane protein n=1 Tax=Arthrobacter echini TaxID=1529066 RepID=A0A4S5E3G4_9MICC|nr:hypothetical protein [Arthrobacter echini]THJ65966.1 hypothetical protein E8P82_09995 [Arthrobacter echini]